MPGRATHLPVLMPGTIPVFTGNAGMGNSAGSSMLTVLFTGICVAYCIPVLFVIDAVRI
ncbi:hypothetical protein DSCW_45480 [Desulfosarcina widdelii]|uniref:Uncharacterized protein n=1 Tax=Desulfosarcina widdelii TaxID=947919 RepID=A0A5K7ZBM4_9BACT|nr:hypothetical protein DSCW_45480 [Desulfosarcina widdelii]